MDAQDALAREQHPVAAVAGRQHAVEEVDALGDRIEQVRGPADAHQIVRRRRRQGLVGGGDQLSAPGGFLAEAEPAVRIAVEAERRRRFRAAPPQVREDSSLDDPEQQLIRPRAGGERALRPAQGARERRFAASTRFRVGWIAAEPAERPAFVERHRDVRAERLLDRHGPLRRQQPLRAVAGRRERDALLVDAAAIAERRDLVPPAVRQPRAAPAGEAVQAAEPGDGVLAGPFVQMEGIGEQDRRADSAQRRRIDPAHGAIGGDRHERRRRHGTVGRRQHADSGAGVPGRDREREALAHHRINIASP